MGKPSGPEEMACGAGLAAGAAEDEEEEEEETTASPTTHVCRSLVLSP